VQAPHSDTGKTETSLYIDNRGYQPKSTYVTDKGTDTGKTYVVTTADDSTDPIRFDHVHINSAAHLVFQNTYLEEEEKQICKTDVLSVIKLLINTGFYY
jgi:hypothetical protein